jgi:AraC-like DNA-binding protein
MNAIHQRPAEPWTIESLAREVSVSRATLARRFAHLLGETPPEYLTRWRMDLAAQRLRDTDDTVAAIAAAVGYRSEYSFHAPSRGRPRPLPAPRSRTGARGRVELDAVCARSLSEVASRQWGRVPAHRPAQGAGTNREHRAAKTDRHCPGFRA